MKKIIAAAVATAFVAPVMAAEVTVSGDLEYVFTKFEGDGNATYVHDQDLKIAASEEADGFAIEAYILNTSRGGTDSAAGQVQLSNPQFGTIAIGTDTSHAINTIDEVADKAEFEMGDSNPSIASAGDDATNVTLLYTLPTLVDGLALMASYGAADGTNDAGSDDEYAINGYAAVFTVGGVSARYATSSNDANSYDTTYTAVSYSSGPVFAAYQVSNNDGAANTDTTGVSLVYNYGSGNLYTEQQTIDTNGSEANDSAVGISYKIGGANIYIQRNSGDTVADNGQFVGVEYAF